MSNPGYFFAQPQQDGKSDPQKLALALMGGNRPYNPQQPYAGIADAGNSLSQAVVQNKMAENAKWAQQGISPVSVTPQQVGGGPMAWMQRNLFNLGGGQ